MGEGVETVHFLVNSAARLQIVRARYRRRMLAERRLSARQRQRRALVNMDGMTPISRRDFAKAAALAGVGVAAATSRAASTTTRPATRAATSRTTAPSTRIRL